MGMLEMIETAAAQAGVTGEQAQAVVNAFLDEVIDTLVHDGRVELRPFGVFEQRLRKGRLGRNPRTGERVAIPDKLTVQFRASSEMQRVLGQLNPEAEKTNQRGAPKP